MSKLQVLLLLDLCGWLSFAIAMKAAFALF
jgi:hypothetical protein